jgi:hypothetical protein
MTRIAPGVDVADRWIAASADTVYDRHPLGRPERKILDAALRLRAPIGVRRHLDRADRVGFGAGIGHVSLHSAQPCARAGI